MNISNSSFSALASCRSWGLLPRFYSARLRVVFVLLSGLLLGGCAAQALSASTHRVSGAVWVYDVEGEFEDVRDDLVDAIESEGMVVSYISHAQAMLSRTAVTVGVAVNVYREAEVVLFCKADMGHRLVAANPHNLVLCPYAVAVYTLNDDDIDRVYLSIRKPEASVKEFAEIHQMLQDLIARVQEG